MKSYWNKNHEFTLEEISLTHIRQNVVNSNSKKNHEMVLEKNHELILKKNHEMALEKNHEFI